MNNKLQIFYACDDAFVKYTIVSLHSMIKNASKEHNYHIHILNTNITDEMKSRVMALENENFEITFDDVTGYLESISEKLPLRHYYSKTTYFRFFISEMFPEYDKALYIDSDTIVLGDISKLFETDIEDYYLAACVEQAMTQVDVYGTYAEEVVGVNRDEFFNAGMMLLNCKAFRENEVLDKFIYYLGQYNFIVTQDEDYLNLICKDNVLLIDQKWNTELTAGLEYSYDVTTANILHYIMVNKPWHYHECRCADIFWDYAKETSVYDMLKEELEAYTDAQRKRDADSADNLYQMAIDETNRPDNYLRRTRQEAHEERLKVIEKIKQYEKEGRFDEDVEDDIPGRTLMPGEVDYLQKKLSTKIMAKVAFGMAEKFVYKLMDDKKLIIKEIKGVEHLKNLKSGAVITCNHFNAYDSFAMELAYREAKQKKRKLFRIIREGNYTSYPGFYGKLMRSCNTLPLSSNPETMKEFVKAVNFHLSKGHFVLIYPEQSMWWNYRKPKPLQNGAFFFAAKAKVPVVPCFITMQDTDIMGEDGFPVQEYTIHISEPIYPDEEKHVGQNTAEMRDKNYEIWKSIYEETYGIKLEY
ncbi:MAG: 1-acyl-sn-glycerol-3-phosphate acyltransferase [Clostridia bacterium]|nr:1-acyl-sn-glycerol-3-phosphate acyltransferase [Clostridia bacterium]